MSVAIATSQRILNAARAHLQGQLEQVCFFRASARDGTLELNEIRAIEPDELELQLSYHLELSDASRSDLIRWAWEADACLVEAHLHTTKGFAEFSPSDYRGFREWVPHVWWRLQGKPYAALVTDGVDWDGLAWMVSPSLPVDVSRLASPEQTIVCTGRSIRAVNQKVADDEL